MIIISSYEIIGILKLQTILSIASCFVQNFLSSEFCLRMIRLSEFAVFISVISICSVSGVFTGERFSFPQLVPGAHPSCQWLTHLLLFLSFLRLAAGMALAI